MDYTKQSAAFKIRKALRYVRLYGPSRTFVKIQGQYHMKRRYASLPRAPESRSGVGHVGLIGCGNFAFSNIAYYLRRNYGSVMRAAMDPDQNRAASLFEKYGLSYYTDDAEKLISDPAIDLIFIASNHASHAEYAIEALKAGKNVHIEKPHAVRREQLVRLCRAMKTSQGKVSLGFNRPGSPIGQEIKRRLDSQRGPAVFNWFIAGHEIEPTHWYFNENEGGRILGNLCHWTDFVFQLVPPESRYPIRITPTPGLRPDCDIAVTYTFGDSTIAAMTFSAKGHAFSGVRERFSAQKGNVLISMDDFQEMRIDEVEKSYRFSSLFREHGHETAIKRSYKSAFSGEGCAIDYVWETGELFLATREALEGNKVVTLTAFEPKALEE